MYEIPALIKRLNSKQLVTMPEEIPAIWLLLKSLCLDWYKVKVSAYVFMRAQYMKDGSRRCPYYESAQILGIPEARYIEVHKVILETLRKSIPQLRGVRLTERDVAHYGPNFHGGTYVTFTEQEAGFLSQLLKELK